MPFLAAYACPDSVWTDNETGDKLTFWEAVLSVAGTLDGMAALHPFRPFGLRQKCLTDEDEDEQGLAAHEEPEAAFVICLLYEAPFSSVPADNDASIQQLQADVGGRQGG
jgi:hypothetical protein